MSDAWLTELKVGDRVFVQGRDSFYPATVEKVTPKLLIVERGKYRRGDGSKVTADIWSHSHLIQPTEDTERRYAARKARVSLREMRWSEFSDVDVLAVIEFVAARHPKKVKR